MVDVTRQIIEQERQAREYVMSKNRGPLEDRVWRSYGILSNARSMTSQEAMQLLSDVRLGIDLGLVEGLEGRILQELWLPFDRHTCSALWDANWKPQNGRLPGQPDPGTSEGVRR